MSKSSQTNLDLLTDLLLKVDREKGPSAVALEAIAPILSSINDLKNWTITSRSVEIDNYTIELWSSTALKEGVIYSLNDAPLQLMVIWLLHKDLLPEITSHIVRSITDSAMIDFDF